MIAPASSRSAVGRLVALVRRGPHEPREPEQQDHHRRADRGAQEPRRLAVQLELPPQLARVVDVLEREQAEPDRRAERAEHGRDPGRGEARLEERGAAIERPAAPATGHQHARQEDGLLVVEPFQQRRDDADADRRGRQVVRGIEPPRQALREQQQDRADDAADEMRGLDDAERQHALEKLEAARRRGRGAREQQHEPDRNVSRPSRRGVSSSVSAPEHRRDPGGLRAALAQLVDASPTSATASGSR